MSHLELAKWNVERLTEIEFETLINYMVEISREKNYGHILDRIPAPKLDEAKVLLAKAYDTLYNEL